MSSSESDETKLAMLFREYAVDPALLGSWQSFRYFVDHFGWSHGRLISEFPRRWRRRVYNEARRRARPVELSRIEYRLRTITDRLIQRENVEDDVELWLPGALAEHAQRPFHAILTSQRAPNAPCCLDGNEVDECEPLWANPGGGRVNARAMDLHATLHLLFAQCHERLLLIDPYLNPSQDRFHTLIQLCLDTLAACGSRGQLELHTTRRSRTTREQVRAFAARVGLSVPLRVVWWDRLRGGDIFHNRYILTERWGVSLGAGIEQRRPGATDDVTRLTPAQYQDRWRQIAEHDGTYRLIDELAIG